MILIEKDEGDNAALYLKKQKQKKNLSHGQFGPSNAVVITAIVNYYYLTYLLIFFYDFFLLIFLVVLFRDQRAVLMQWEKNCRVEEH